MRPLGGATAEDFVASVALHRCDMFFCAFCVFIGRVGLDGYGCKYG